MASLQGNQASVAVETHPARRGTDEPRSSSETVSPSCKGKSSTHIPTQPSVFAAGQSTPTRPTVDLDFFDPAGMQELQRTLTNQSQVAKNPSHSDLTLNGLEIGDGPFDLEKFLRKIMKQMDAADNVQRRELGVLFQDLCVVGTGASVSYQPTVASFFDIKSHLRAFQNLRHPATRDILSGFEGDVRPGEMLLVLGRPGAGCSTLLKVLANHRSDYHSIEGTVHYDSLTPDEITKHFRGDVQYCPEDDVHFPTLTVEQTLRFAAATRTPSQRLDGRSREDAVKLLVDVLTTVFGLRRVRDTKVGDAWVRGISGGQKKRVSLSEALATRSLLNCWDNSTRGLDASTALEFVQALRIATDVARMTTIVSIYQAGESLYKLFDKVCVIYEGRMAYFGPANKARQYFIDLGYTPANRQTTADFLVAVTDPNGRIPRPGVTNRPRTPEEFAKAFLASPLCEENRRDMLKYQSEFVGNTRRQSQYRMSAYNDHAKHTRKGSPYLTSVPMQVRALMKRRVQILGGDKVTFALNFILFVVKAIIVGTIFVQLKDSTSAFFSRGGVLFFSMLFAALTAMAEIPALFSQRPIVLRHYRAAMYHPFVESMALTFVDFPITFVTLLCFSIILYFLVGLQKTASQFFIFLLFVFVMTLTMKAWFRALAAAFHTAAPAQTLAGLSLLLLTLYAGYTIPQPSMIGGLKWLTYISPLKYGFEGLMVNEFHGISAGCATFVPSGPGYDGQVSIDNQVCTTVGSVSGQLGVDGDRYILLSYDYQYSHLWRNFGIICAFGIAFVFIYWILTELNTRTSGERSVTWFKRGSNVPPTHTHGSEDEEAGHADASDPALDEKQAGGHSTEKAAMKVEAGAGAPAMTDIFSWQHLDYTVTMPDGSERKLLDDISGYVAPGKLTALMGESGAGKTTLLNALAERTYTGVVRGDRLVNGHALPKDFQAQTGYCQQLDTHLETSTVREALLFSAKMRQPPHVPMSEKEAYVEKCLEMCGLTAFADAVVGTLGVEMKKRTTIAVELVAKPKLLLFLDEPTSGLDSQSAWAIVAFLRELADKAGQAILCTIHQPSGELFQVFDRLLLLKVGGKTVYFGDLGYNSSDLIGYFEKNGARHCETEENPAEYILQVIGAGASATIDRDWNQIWKESPEAMKLQHEIEAIHEEGRKHPAVETTLHTEFATGWPHQLVTLLHRDLLDHWRNPTIIFSKIALNIVAGLFIGFTFFKSKDSLQGTQDKLFACFMATIVSVPVAQQLQIAFIAVRNIYEVRERPSKMYSWTALVTSQILAEIPWNIFGSTLLYFCWYFTVGFPTEAPRAGYVYLALGIIFPLYYTTVGQATAAMSPNSQTAALLFSFLFSFVLIFNGVLQPYQHLGWWKWMYRISPYSYLIEGLLGTVIGHQDINCAAVEFVRLNPPSGLNCSSYLDPFISFAGGYLANPDDTSSCAYCPYRTSDRYLLDNFSISYSHRWRNIGILVAFIAFNTIATYVFTYMFRIRSGSFLPSFKRRASAKH
ncbi:hypothetical protein PHLGIDRAFT_102023 [Phlebiopsis gigantea 11061_1 CR5-6]|uniref:ABC transporter domain-containing protein n=1 Tax=Phlebiopsis gigantea (strain 11061_1 CR5-6) TaxID=745531 RepID=A0A0C3SDU2_PHLG1|nr:hypothetical protein PHLGIDRAFT_102023 [Phlebiopsis gigantea 11061_1 CR5-6]